MNRITAGIAAASIMGLSIGLGAASAPLQPATMPPISAGRVEIDQLKLLSDRLDKLESKDAQKSAQIATLTAQVTALQTSLTAAQANLSTLQSRVNDTIPASGPGNCASRGYTNAASLPANPALLVYTWGMCKVP